MWLCRLCEWDIGCTCCVNGKCDCAGCVSGICDCAGCVSGKCGCAGCVSGICDCAVCVSGICGCAGCVSGICGCAVCVSGICGCAGCLNTTEVGKTLISLPILQNSHNHQVKVSKGLLEKKCKYEPLHFSTNIATWLQVSPYVHQWFILIRKSRLPEGYTSQYLFYLLNQNSGS